MSKVVILIYLRSFSSESESNDGPSEVALALAHLQSLHNCTESQDTSSYADNGTDPKRLKELLKEPPCDCQCRVPFKGIGCYSQNILGPTERDARFSFVVSPVFEREKNEMVD